VGFDFLFFCARLQGFGCYLRFADCVSPDNPRVSVAEGPGVYRFGPFAFDPVHRCVFRDGQTILLTPRQSDALKALVSKAGRVMTKFELTEHAWDGAAVTHNSVAQIMSELRELLDDTADNPRYIETVHRTGYRFIAPITEGPPVTDGPPVTHVPVRPSTESIDEPVEPHLALTDGRALIEMLDLDLLPLAGEHFAKGRILTPHLAAPYIGLAMVDVLTYESRRVDLDRNPALLESALLNASEACLRDPASGEARMTRGFIRYVRGEIREAIAECRHGVLLEPRQCRHELRRTRVNWGDARLEAGDCTLKLLPTLALAYLFMAEVYIARGALDQALRCLELGCAAQQAQRARGGRVNAVGLYLLYGLVLMALGRIGEALEAFARERALEGGRHVYGRECAAHLRYATGWAHVRQGRRAEGDAMFEEGLAIVPGHPLLLSALGEMPSLPAAPKPADGTNIDVAIVMAAIFTRAGKPEAGARVIHADLSRVDPGPAGWMLPIEPSIHATAHRDVWARTLALLADRAV
jgi:DNA-binding winged helix-turn-helix (wHTH) protein/tetratricopeptide (TPR) repeat protein